VNTSIVFTFIGADKPGLLEKLSNTVSQHGGNWQESRMSQLAGQFAGITRVSVTDQDAHALMEALKRLSGDELTLTVQTGHNGTQHQPNLRTVTIIGNDRPGIVREVSAALAGRQINVCEMNSLITSAPMTGEPLFEAQVLIDCGEGIDYVELSEQLDEIANDLSVDIVLED
jgi:glycine cleavage system regulatory protein